MSLIGYKKYETTHVCGWYNKSTSCSHGIFSISIPSVSRSWRREQDASPLERITDGAEHVAIGADASLSVNTSYMLISGRRHAYPRASCISSFITHESPFCGHQALGCGHSDLYNSKASSLHGCLGAFHRLRVHVNVIVSNGSIGRVHHVIASPVCYLCLVYHPPNTTRKCNCHINLYGIRRSILRLHWSPTLPNDYGMLIYKFQG